MPAAWNAWTSGRRTMTKDFTLWILSLMRDAELRQALKDAHYFTIARDIKRETRLRLGSWTAGEISETEALKKYLESKKVSPEREKTLLEYGEKLIQGKKTH